MIKFEKVSYEQFKKDSEKLGLEATQEIYDAIKLPKRSSVGSAGYDFYLPYPVHLGLRRMTTIPTGIRVILPDNLFLMLVPRSGLGFKSGMHLANTTGIIDASFYKTECEGHIMAKLIYGFDSCVLEAGDRFMQGIIMEYYKTDDDSVTEERKGGFGSSGVK